MPHLLWGLDVWPLPYAGCGPTGRLMLNTPLSEQGCACVSSSNASHHQEETGMESGSLRNLRWSDAYVLT